MMPLCSMFCCIFVGWILNRELVKREATSDGKIGFGSFNIWMMMVKFVAPAAILVIFFTGLKW